MNNILKYIPITTSDTMVVEIVVGVVVVSLSLVFRRKQLSPKKPLLTCILDTMLQPLQYFKIGQWAIPYTVEGQLEVAKKNTNLTYLNIDKNEKFSFIDRYNVSYNSSFKQCTATTSPLGHLMRSRSLLRRLEIRLQMADFIKKYPKVVEKKSFASSPVFVIGFPRTGK